LNSLKHELKKFYTEEFVKVVIT